MTVLEKYQNLVTILASHGKVAVAFSGGVDSSLLCQAAVDALGAQNALAITVVSPMMPRREVEDAQAIARHVGIRHLEIVDNEIEEEVAANPENRCYHCKKIEFGHIQNLARENGFVAVVEGSNMDDMNDYRPGLKATEEMKVFSPLREAGLYKAEIRELSKLKELPTWDKPAFACLGSRIPYGESIDIRKLTRVEKAEDYLFKAGFKQFRVRSHGEQARIEVAPIERDRFFSVEFMDQVSKAFKGMGFIYVSLELSGYRQGSLNAVLRMAQD